MALSSRALECGYHGGRTTAGRREHAGAAGGRARAQARGIRGRRAAHPPRVVRRRPHRVRQGRSAPMAPRARRQARRSGATMGEAALARNGGAAASALPLRHDRRLQDAGGAAAAAQVRTARGSGGVAAPIREDPDPSRRRRRARDDRRASARADPAARRSRARAPHRETGLRPAAGDAAAEAVLRDAPGADGQREVAAPRPVVRGRGGQLDRGRSALPGRDRSAAPRLLADGRGGAARTGQARLDRQARGSRGMPTIRAIPAPGCSTGAGAGAATRRRHAANRSST